MDFQEQGRERGEIGMHWLYAFLVLAKKVSCQKNQCIPSLSVRRIKVMKTEEIVEHSEGLWAEVRRLRDSPKAVLSFRSLAVYVAMLFGLVFELAKKVKRIEERLDSFESVPGQNQNR